MAKIKRKILQDFTTVKNDFLRDNELGFTERGLLITMLSLPDGWDFSAIGLASIVPDGKKKTNHSLQRLEKAGYLHRSRIYENGKVVDWLYEFCDQPVFKNQNLFAQKGEVEENLLTHFVEVEKVEVENGQDNKRSNELNTKESNTVFNQSIYHGEEPAEAALPKKKEIDRLIDEELIEEVKEQIFYNGLIEDDKISGDEVDLAVDVLAKMLTATKPDEIGGGTYSPEVIRGRAKIVDYNYMQYVFKCIHAQTGKIHNIRKYIKTTIFNAPVTIGSYYANTMRSDAAPKAKSSQSSFDVDDFFEAAVKRSMGETFAPAILKQ